MPRPHASPLWRARSGWRVGGAVPTTVLLEDEVGIVHAVDLPPVEGLNEPDTAIDADGAVWVHADGVTHRLRPVARRAAMERRLAARERGADAADPDVRAPMPGAVVAMHAADGDHVAAGHRILTIEAMKMEHPVTAPHDGIVRVEVATGDQVRRDQVLAHVAPEPG